MDKYMSIWEYLAIVVPAMGVGVVFGSYLNGSDRVPGVIGVAAAVLGFVLYKIGQRRAPHEQRGDR